MLELPYARFVQLVRRAAKEHASQERLEYKRAAFVGWQTMTAMGASLRFDEYLEHFKLGAEQPALQEHPNVTTAQALEIAERIRKMDRDRTKN